jgi:putative ABC transport system permease protein
MPAVWLRVRHGLRLDWRTPAGLMLVVALMGAVVLVSLAGARRTDTAVSRFLAYAGVTQGEVSASPAMLRRVTALPSVAWAQRGALVFAVPYAHGRPQGQVLPWAILDRPPRVRPIIVAGRLADLSQPGQAMINESAARALHAGLGSVIALRGYRPSQARQVLTGANVPPRVRLPPVRVVGIIRLPKDLATNLDVPADVSYQGTGAVYLGRAFYQQVHDRVANNLGLSVALRRGSAGMPAFEAQVRAVSHGRAQARAGSDDLVAAAAAQRGTSLQALALALFGVLVAVALLVIVAQGLARLTWASSTDFPVLRALGCSRDQLFAMALIPAALISAGGMALAVPAAWALSGLTPIGLARQAEVSPGLQFDAPILLGGAAVLTALLTARAAVTAWRVARLRAAPGLAGGGGGGPGPGSRAGRWAARRQLPPPVVAGLRLAFEPGQGAAAVPVRPAVTGIAGSLAAVTAVLIFGASLAGLITDPPATGWAWSAAIERGLRGDPDVTGYTATAPGETRIGGRDIQLIGFDPLRGDVVPPVLSGRLPRAPGEIALGGADLRALHQHVGGTVRAGTARRAVALRITGQVVLTPEITNEQSRLGSGGVMTLAGADAVTGSRLPRNVFLVQLRPGRAEAAGLDGLRRRFPGVVLPAIPPPEVRNLRQVSGLPLVLALLLGLLAIGTVTHTLVTSVRRRRQDLAILKVVGFVRGQIRAAVAWQATAIALAGLIVGLPLGAAAGRWAWLAFAGQFAIRPVPVLSPLVLLAVPAVLLLANAAAALPGRAAARTRPAVTLRAE